LRIDACFVGGQAQVLRKLLPCFGKQGLRRHSQSDSSDKVANSSA
jgi:hypothetical protein